MTYTADSTMANNEVYNLPYSGIAIGYGWGANDAGRQPGLHRPRPVQLPAEVHHRDHRGEQPRHGQLRPRRDAADDRRRLRSTTCRRSPGTTVNQNYFRNTNGWLGLYFDEGSRYVSAANNVFENIGQLGLRAAVGEQQHRQPDADQQLDDQQRHATSRPAPGATPTPGRSSSPAATGRAAHAPSWPRPVCSRHPAADHHVRVRGVASGRCLDIAGASQTNGALARHLGLPRRREPAAGPCTASR